MMRRLLAALIAVPAVAVPIVAFADSDADDGHVTVLPGEGPWQVAARLCPHNVGAQFEALYRENPWLEGYLVSEVLHPGAVLHSAPASCPPPTTTTTTTTTTTEAPSTSTTTSTTLSPSSTAPSTTSLPSMTSTSSTNPSTTSTLPASTTTVPAGTWHGYVKPGPNNTGPTSDPATFIRVTAAQLEAMMTPGRVITNVYITGGDVDLVANNVTIRNFVLDGNGGRYGFAIRTGFVGLTLEDGEIFDTLSSGVLGMGFTARRLDVHHTGNDAFKTQNAGPGPHGPVLIESSWWHHLGNAPEAHGDGVQAQAHSYPVVVRGNHCDMPRPLSGYVHTSCFMLDPPSGPVLYTIEYNWLNGGAFTVYCEGTPNLDVVRYNRFGRNSLYGTSSADVCNEWYGNVWDDTGQPVQQ